MIRADNWVLWAGLTAFIIVGGFVLIGVFAATPEEVVE